jgi:hypothetical protein
MGNNGRHEGEMGNETVFYGVLSHSSKIATTQHLDQKTQNIKISGTNNNNAKH